ncbi:putative ABC transport system permease protein [Pseudobutyrivibrio sp. YE44]|uniref:ABC transporter permease n=1 Tax=Pseudobutyrivibrio sp. YE44 TaxID=1520802 RepID=UPI00088A6447|nr:ABC transporter permease [Pseudobutyrivibrio sp. YE44]SDB24354.1 putative ABC transport system permease protein [Pseudobutyrivibrio sp. YE44]
MLFTENVLVALAGLKANIMRSLLTMLGIIIGIASVIAIMTVGNSITLIVNSTMQDIGANNLQMGVMEKSRDSETSDDGMSYGSGYIRDMTDEDLITKDMLKEFKEEYSDNIKYILLNENIGGDYGSPQSKVSHGSKSANVKIVGYNKDYMEFNKREVLAGREFLTQDYAEGKKVCMVSDKMVERLYKGDNDSVLGQEIEITMGNTYYTYHVVGVYKYVEEQFSFGASDNPTTEVMIPLQTARIENHTQNKGYSFLMLVTSVDTDNNTFATTVRDFFNSHYYSRNDAYEVAVISMASMMDSMNSMISMIQLALSVIAGISLVVGGIGVMNIMLVSITERTKEIGTRKALGAKNSSIRLQFITESVVICLIGGVIGIVLGVGLGTVAVKLMGYSAAVSPSSIIIAVGFSMAIGVFFGYYPANKAAKLNPIDALRYE